MEKITSAYNRDLLWYVCLKPANYHFNRRVIDFVGEGEISYPEFFIFGTPLMENMTLFIIKRRPVTGSLIDEIN